MPLTNLIRRGQWLCLFLILALVSPGLPALAEDAVPSAFAKGRYEALRTSSPFALATAVVVAAPQASFAANWYVGGVARNGDDYFVTIQSRDLSKQFSLVSGREVDGVMLASVNWSDQVGKSTVILRKGTETAKLEFNEAQLRGPATTAAASPAPGGKATAATAGGTQRLVGQNVAAVKAGGLPPVANSSATVRRRALPIPVPPR
ncbi:MAG: hypothetical protein ABJF10_08190 [Chthoniobacter sp.]|uniref:hypothetical protein n=1 Tax=Chthoniobacter sp. TaxID=2510640 RepID=UPI0032A42A18